MLLPLLAVGQSSFEFKKLSSGAGPSPRVDAPVAYDEVSRRLLVFGGLDESGDRNDLWAFSLETNQWQELRPLGDLPGTRHGHTFDYDPVRRRAIVIAGQARGFFRDVWAYDIGTNTWNRLADGTGPSSRYAHSTIYDKRRDRLVLSHGFTSESGRFDDTWAFDLRTSTWLNVTPGGTKPLRRCLHHAVYDEAGDQFFLYGGCSSGFGPCPQGDLWAFNLGKSTWSQRTTSGAPPARERYGMTFDSTRRLLVLYGGSGSSGLLNDVWTYNPGSDAWTKEAPGGATPQARFRQESVFVKDRNAAIFFGGSTSTATNELLQLAAPAAAGQVRGAFAGETTPASPGAIKSIYGAGFGPAEGVSAPYDAGGRLPFLLAGTEVRVNGVLAPLYFVRNDQVNFQIPYETAGQVQALVRMVVNGTTIYEEQLMIAAVAPDLHSYIGQTNDVVVLYLSGYGATAPASSSGERAAGQWRPAAAVSVRFGDRPAEVLYAALAPGTTGVLQINARVPAGLSGDVAIKVRVGDAETSRSFRLR